MIQHAREVASCDLRRMVRGLRSEFTTAQRIVTEGASALCFCGRKLTFLACQSLKLWFAHSSLFLGHALFQQYCCMPRKNGRTMQRPRSP